MRVGLSTVNVSPCQPLRFGQQKAQPKVDELSKAQHEIKILNEKLNVACLFAATSPHADAFVKEVKSVNFASANNKK